MPDSDRELDKGIGLNIDPNDPRLQEGPSDGWRTRAELAKKRKSGVSLNGLPDFKKDSRK